MNQGTKANRSGHSAEQIIAHVLTDHGFQFKRQHRLCESIYGHPIRVDFFIENADGYPDGLAIECKWQDVSGSIDEKLPYLVLNIKEKFPCPAVIMLDGEGHKPGAINWITSQTDDKLLAVFSISEFHSWVLRTLKPLNSVRCHGDI